MNFPRRLLRAFPTLKTSVCIAAATAGASGVTLNP